MTILHKVLEKTIKEITPTDREIEDTFSIIKKIEKETERILKEEGMGLSYTVAGSYVRNTWMRYKKEFDLFILFPESVSREVLEEKGLEIGSMIVDAFRGGKEIAYAEHPYTRARILGYDVDIVPAFKIKDTRKLKSSVDRTPFHNKWLAKNIKENHTSQVRLLKQFTKSNGLYGSDTRMEGFSGYLCELLIIHYGSFEKLLKQATTWNPGIIINIEGHKLDDELIHKKFKNQPLIVIDPVDGKRNVSAVVSPLVFVGFIDLCRRFLKNPGEGFFFRKPVKMTPAFIKEVNGRGTKIYGVMFKPPRVIPDVLWPQLRRTSRRVKDILEEEGFRVINHAEWSDEKKICMMLFEMETWELPGIRKIEGPPIFAVKNSSDFRKKYREGRTYVEGLNWHAEVERKHKTAQGKLKSTLKVKKSDLLHKGIASHIAESLDKAHSIMEWKDMVSLARQNKDFWEFLHGFFKRDFDI